jgi:hypothetical protein
MFSHRAPVSVLERLFAAVLVGLVFTGVGRAAPNPTCTVQVVAGQSIQDAIDVAATGATVCVGPGTYRENLLINKDGITLKGAGPEKTVLEPPTQPRPFCPVLQIPPIGDENFGLNGICVADLDPQGKVLRTVNDVRVTGFTVRDLSGIGILFGGTNRSRADHNAAAGNKSYGITAFLSTHGRFGTTRATAAVTPASTWATHQTPTSRFDTTRLLPTSGGFWCGMRPMAV